MTQKRTFIAIQGVPKTAEIDQTWPFFLLPTSAVALLSYLRQSTKCAWHLYHTQQAKYHRRATADGRRVVAGDYGHAILPGRMAPGRTTLLAFNPRSRACGVPLELPRSGTICALLNGADSERARSREAGAERWPTFCGLRRFASNSKHKKPPWKAQEAKPRKPQKRCSATVCGYPLSTPTFPRGQHNTAGQCLRKL